jgi:hypothetical protein
LNAIFPKRIAGIPWRRTRGIRLQTGSHLKKSCRLSCGSFFPFSKETLVDATLQFPPEGGGNAEDNSLPWVLKPRLAYHPFAPPATASLVTHPRWWQAFPVVDSQRWSGFALFVGFNDAFFMSLMFFLSGLFVWRSLGLSDGVALFIHGQAWPTLALSTFPALRCRPMISLS